MKKIIAIAVAFFSVHCFAQNIFTYGKYAVSKNELLRAFNKNNNTYKDLKSGKKFEAVAEQYSDDELVKTNMGNIGYITVFSLPYQLENVIYNTIPGNFSTPIRTKSGYHIFKVNNERPSA